MDRYFNSVVGPGDAPLFFNPLYNNCACRIQKMRFRYHRQVKVRLHDVKNKDLTKLCLERGVNSKDSAFIVQKHNELRKRVARGELTDQPQGINLRRVVSLLNPNNFNLICVFQYWDELLANATQELADLCIFEKVDNVKDGKSVTFR